MSHADEVKKAVDDTLAAGVIAGMNGLLIALGDDDVLAQEERYREQQRLRTAIAHHGRPFKEDDALSDSVATGTK